MDCYYVGGAMYIELDNEEVIKESVQLGDGILKPGQYVNKLGEKKRSMFEMNDGFYLKYEGYVTTHYKSKELLFSTNCTGDEPRNDRMFYAFTYIDSETLLVINPHKGCGYDIRIENLEAFDDVEYIDLRIGKQISLLEGAYEQ